MIDESLRIENTRPLNQPLATGTKPIFINGKFFGQRVTGVQRFARETVAALDLLIEEPQFARYKGRFTVLLPTLTEAQKPRLQNISIVNVDGRASHMWEQFKLPVASRGGLLLNLSGSAPILNPGQICTLHDAAVFDFSSAYSRGFRLWYQNAFKIHARLASRILTVSEFSKSRLIHHLGVSPHKIGVIPNGSDHISRIQPVEDILKRLVLTPRRYLLAVGSSHPAKNFAKLMSAFQSLDADGMTLVVVGGKNSSVFASVHDDSPYNARNVVYAGAVSDGDLISLYANALAFIFPSLYEGFGIPPLEAMACGCPVAASNAASIPEVCGEAVTYFDPHSAEDISSAMQRIISSEQLRDDLTARGRARAAQYTWRRAAVEVLENLDIR